MAPLPPTTTISSPLPLTPLTIFGDLARIKLIEAAEDDMLRLYLSGTQSESFDDETSDYLALAAEAGGYTLLDEQPDKSSLLPFGPPWPPSPPPLLRPPPAPKPSAQPPPPKLPTTKPSAPPKAQTPVKAPPKPSAQTPSFASITKSPARPSLVLSPAPNSSPTTAVRKTPSEICAHLNGVLSTLLPGSSLSAARWTKNNNLVIVAGPDTTSQHLQKASAALSTAVTHFIAANPSQPIPISAKENVRWSRLLINNVPTGVSPSRGAYSPTECHDTLIRDNPAYRTLSLTRLPSWVKCPNSYAAGSSSSLVVCFEDPTGLALRTLLSHKTLFAFGQAGDLRPWKQKPRAKAPTTLSDRPPVPA
ncbi:hypothetical protein EDB85DRAFT_2149033 [Lactarius pseudohatsudake]|nr:hypothetical protein EDB85DRAFT_2149033 [Lactarius pseudohatsudake]